MCWTSPAAMANRRSGPAMHRPPMTIARYRIIRLKIFKGSGILIRQPGHLGAAGKGGRDAPDRFSYRLCGPLDHRPWRLGAGHIAAQTGAANSPADACRAEAAEATETADCHSRDPARRSGRGDGPARRRTAERKIEEHLPRLLNGAFIGSAAPVPEIFDRPPRRRIRAGVCRGRLRRRRARSRGRVSPRRRPPRFL